LPDRIRLIELFAFRKLIMNKFIQSAVSIVGLTLLIACGGGNDFDSTLVRSAPTQLLSVQEFVAPDAQELDNERSFSIEMNRRYQEQQQTQAAASSAGPVPASW
jgi:hypothetical protein